MNEDPAAPRFPHLEAPLATIAYRGLTLALAATALVGQGVNLYAMYWNALGVGSLAQGGTQPALLSAVMTGAVVSAVSAALAATMAFRGNGVRGALPLSVALGAWAYLLAYSGLTILLSPDPSSPLRLAFEGHFLLVEGLGLAALLRFTTQFPLLLPPGALRRPDTLPVGLRTAQHVRLWLFHPAGPWVAGVAATLLILGVNGALGRSTQDAALLPLTDVFRLLAIALVVLNLRRGFLAADREGRRSTFWLVVGFTLLVGAVGILLGGNVLVAVTGWRLPGVNWRPVVLSLGVLGLLWGMTMGVFYRGSLRPGVVTRRMTVLCAMATAALFLAAGMETLLGGRGVSRGVGTLLSLVGVGLLYARARRPLEGMLYHAWAEAPAADDAR